MEIKELKLHFFYVVGILILCIVLIATGLWTEKENFTEYLTNAATAISIVLGLVAIFYSFISNSSLSQSLGNISKISDEVIQTKTEIEKFLSHADELEKMGASNTQVLKDISGSVEHHVSSLKTTLGSVTEITQLIHNSVEVLPGKIDQLESRLTKADINHTTEPQVNAVNIDQFATNFMQLSSINGRMMLYGCLLANIHNKIFSIDEFARKTDINADYSHGYFVACEAAQFLQKEFINDDYKIFKIISINETIKNELKNIILSRLGDTYEQTNPELVETHKNKLKLIEDMYQ